MQNKQRKITPYLTFFGQAKEAIEMYTSLFDDSAILNVNYHEDGKVMHATFSIKGQIYMCSDSMLKHNWTFTPALSLFVTCDTEEEMHRLFKVLSKNGKVHMPLDNYGFSQMFGWVDDKFGVSWQLNLA